MADSNRVAVVTGASSGIGEEFARQLCAKGFTVLAAARRLDRLEVLAGRESKKGPGRIVALQADLEQDGTAQKIAEVARTLGPVRWVVNNAGFSSYGAARDQDPRRLASMVRVNCEAVVSLTLALLPDLVAAKEGVLLNVASVSGFQPVPWMAVYGATKAFVLSFGEALSVELAGSGVKVTTLCPGPVDTEFNQVAQYRMKGNAPGMIGAADCAARGIADAERGVVISVPGGLNAAAARLGRLLPRSAVRAIAGRVMRRYSND
jgi:short-subunit dehydrogenase